MEPFRGKFVVIETFVHFKTLIIKIDMKIRKIGFTLLIALLGGLEAIGGYKILENKQIQNMTFEEGQKAYFASNPLKIGSSAGNPDFTEAARAVRPAVVHIDPTYEASGNSGRRGASSPFDMFEEFFGSPRSRTPRQPSRASGSGVIISTDG